MSVIAFLIIGAFAGWLAGILMKTRRSGFAINIVIGILGAFLGGFVFSVLGLAATGLIGYVITATAGAALLLWLIGLIKR